jgi:hypothetical protein
MPGLEESPWKDLNTNSYFVQVSDIFKKQNIVKRKLHGLLLNQNSNKKTNHGNITRISSAVALLAPLM